MVQYEVVSQANELSDSAKVNAEAEEGPVLEALASPSSSPLSPLSSRLPSTSLQKASSASSSVHLDDVVVHQHRSNVDFKVSKATLADNTRATSDHGKTRNAKGGKTGMQEMTAKHNTGHGATQSVQDTAMIVKSDATEAQVCFV